MARFGTALVPQGTLGLSLCSPNLRFSCVMFISDPEGDRTKWYGQNGMDKMVYGQNCIGQNGMDKMVQFYILCTF